MAEPLVAADVRLGLCKVSAITTRGSRQLRVDDERRSVPGKGRRDVSERFKRKTGFESPRTPQDK
jgi:hypothetical protein